MLCHQRHLGCACRARDWVATQLDLQHDAKLSLFEVTIRIVGGLIAAYDACGDAVFLTKADELASKMLDNFRSTEQGVLKHLHLIYTNVPLNIFRCCTWIPMESHNVELSHVCSSSSMPSAIVCKLTAVCLAGKQTVLPVNEVFLNPHSLETMRAKANTPETVSLAEFGSFSLEWHALSARTGKPEYGIQADKIIDGLNQRYPKQVKAWPSDKERKANFVHRNTSCGVVCLWWCCMWCAW